MRAFTKSEATEFATKAIAAMAMRGISPTPQNYAVWFAYVAGIHPTLTRTIETIESNRREFTEERNAELHDVFFGAIDRSSAVGKTANDVHDAIGRLLSLIADAGGDAGRFADALQDYSGQLAAAPDADTVKNIVTGLAVETASLKERNQALEVRLTDTSKEVALLRDNLDIVRREAMTDALTGIANRKAFETALHDTMQSASETGAVFSLLMVDIDHFKKFNDNFGHPLGDQVLRLVACTLKESIKGRDVAARYGGEEFAIILPETFIADGATVAEQIRRAVESRAIRRKTTGEELARITLSIGVAEFRLGEPKSDVIERADAALYVAKRSGRNRVTTETRLAVPAA